MKAVTVTMIVDTNDDAQAWSVVFDGMEEFTADEVVSIDIGAVRDLTAEEVQDVAELAG